MIIYVNFVMSNLLPLQWLFTYTQKVIDVVFYIKKNQYA